MLTQDSFRVDGVQQYVVFVLFNSQEFIIQLAVGAALGTSKAGIGIAGLGTFKPELIMKVSAELSNRFCIHSTKNIPVVSRTRRYVWNCRSVWISCLGSNCRRPYVSSNLVSFQSSDHALQLNLANIHYMRDSFISGQV